MFHLLFQLKLILINQKESRFIQTRIYQLKHWKFSLNWDSNCIHFQNKEEYIVSANEESYLSSIINTKLYHVNIKKCINFKYPYKNFIIMKNTSISAYHSTPITAYYFLLKFILKSGSHHHFKLVRNISQFLYFYQIWIYLIS